MLQLLRKSGPSATTDASPPKQWFVDEAMDLIVSRDPTGTIRAFQLCYGKPWTQKALMWTEGNGMGHFTVDDGEARPTENRTPLLQPGGPHNLASLTDEFLGRAHNVDVAISRFVVEKIAQYAAEQQP
jgi:hypothetical protein